MIFLEFIVYRIKFLYTRTLGFFPDQGPSRPFYSLLSRTPWLWSLVRPEYLEVGSLRWRYRRTQTRLDEIEVDLPKWERGRGDTRKQIERKTTEYEDGGTLRITTSGEPEKILGSENDRNQSGSQGERWVEEERRTDWSLKVLLH